MDPSRRTAAWFLALSALGGCAGASASGPGAGLEGKCNLQHEASACVELGSAARGAKDLAGAKGWFEKGCNGGSAEGCFGAAEVLVETKGSDDDARTFYSRACEMGHAKGCFESAKRWLPVALEREKARAHLIVSCDKNLGPACFLLGKLYEEDADAIAAERRFVAACDFGVGEGCTAVGFQKVMNAIPLGDQSKEREAMQWFERGCSQEDEASCGVLKRLRNQPLSRGVRFTLARVQRVDGGAVRLRQAGHDLPPVGVSAKVEPFAAGAQAKGGASVRDSGSAGVVLGGAGELKTGDMIWLTWDEAPVQPVGPPVVQNGPAPSQPESPPPPPPSP